MLLLIMRFKLLLAMKIIKFFNDRALGLFSTSTLFGLLLLLRSEDIPVLNIVMWVVTGLFLALFFVRLSVLLFGKDAGFLAIKGGGAGQMFVFPALLLLFTVEFYSRENMTAAIVSLVLFVLSLAGTVLVAIKDFSKRRN